MSNDTPSGRNWRDDLSVEALDWLDDDMLANNAYDEDDADEDEAE